MRRYSSKTWEWPEIRKKVCLVANLVINENSTLTREERHAHSRTTYCDDHRCQRQPKRQKLHPQDPRNIKLRGKDATTHLRETGVVAILRRLPHSASRTLGAIGCPRRTQLIRVATVITPLRSVNRHLIVDI